MTWRDEWNAIAAHIKGITEAADLLAQTMQARMVERGPSNSYLGVQTGKIIRLLGDFSSRNSSSLPGAVAEAVSAFQHEYGNKNLRLYDNTFTAIVGPITGLALLRAEVDYLISDFSATTRRRSERAFLHLQRSILIDDSYRTKWIEAFQTHETHCEKLGALHLLSHGLYAFKIDAFNERTDIMLNENLAVDDDLTSAIDAFVMTEWKLVKHNDQVQKAVEARKQSERYQTGAALGVELTDTRYIVLVSDQDLVKIDDLSENGIHYIHITIEIAPGTASVRAKRAARPPREAFP